MVRMIKSRRYRLILVATILVFRQTDSSIITIWDIETPMNFNVDPEYVNMRFQLLTELG